MKSLQEIEEAIAKLPANARRQLVQDIPALCPAEFPPDGWDAILNDPSPRPGLSVLLDELDEKPTEQETPASFLKALGELRAGKTIPIIDRHFDQPPV